MAKKTKTKPSAQTVEKPPYSELLAEISRPETQEELFITSVLKNTKDRLTCLAYADWLEENDRLDEATAWREPKRITLPKLQIHSQEALACWRRVWMRIGLSTGDANRNAAECAIREIYRIDGLGKPGFVWFDSPFEAAVFAAKSTYRSCSFFQSLHASVRYRKRGFYLRDTLDAVYDLHGNIERPIESIVHDVLVRKAVQQIKRQRVLLRDRNMHFFYGVHDAGELASVSYQHLMLASRSLVMPLVRLAMSGCGWWWPTENLVIISRRPCSLTWKDGELVGAAYSDYWRWGQ